MLSETWLQQLIHQEVGKVELVMLEEVDDGRRRIIRLYIDSPQGVSHDLCGRVSAVVSQGLDELGLINEPYVLEVSSPGVKRPLVRPSHFAAQVGKKVHVKTKEPIEGSEVWQGVLLSAGPAEIVVQEPGRQARIPLSAVKSAHLVYEFELGGRG